MGKVISEITGYLYGNNLKARGARSILVLSSGTVVERGLRFVRNMILARLLVPGELGLMALIIAVTIVFEALTEVGIKQSIIYNKNGASREYLNVAWWIQGFRGLCLYGVVFLCAPWVTRFYFENKPDVIALYQLPQIVTFLRVSFLAILFNGLVSPRAHVLEKRFRFGRVLLIQHGAGIVSALLIIALTFYLRNIQALVIGFATEGFLRFLFSFLVCPFLPEFKFDVESRRQIITFARGMLGLPFITILAIQTDVVVLGKVVSAELLGKYAMAFTLARMPLELYFQTLGRVLLPAFSERQNDKKFLCDSIYTVVRCTAIIGIPVVLFMFVSARPLLSVVFGPPFSQAAVAFGILTICCLLRTQEAVSTAVFLGIGKPHLHRRFLIVRAIIIVCLMYPASAAFGLTGASLVLTVGNFITVCLQVLGMRKVINLNVKQYLYSWFEDIRLSLIVLVPLGLLILLKLEFPLVKIGIGIGSCLIVWSLGLLRIHNFLKRSIPSTSLED